MIDVDRIRDDFPILHQKVYNKPFVYLDNAATTQKPKPVIDAITNFYSLINSNVHRGVHYLSDKATVAYEDARKSVQSFMNARHVHEIVFTKGTTDAINLLAFSFGERYVEPGDEILISGLEHHSNIVPWQMLCERKNAKLRVIPVNDVGELDLSNLDALINSKTRLVAITQVSNLLGTVIPVKQIIDIAHSKNVPVLIDGAQSIQHLQVDVQELDCDFFTFSGHKIYASTGIGILYGKEKLLNELPPYQGGGNMIKSVTFDKTIYNDLPYKFEAGTTDFVGAISLHKAIQYIQNIGLHDIVSYENNLLEYATNELLAMDGVRIIGTAKNKVSVLSFLIQDVHHYDAGMVMDKTGIAIRTGKHCAEPVIARLGINGTIRASFAFYNTFEEINRLCEAVKRVKKMFL